jgi:hypothetical protein
MYDNTDVAFVIGGLISAGIAGVTLIVALVMLGICVHRAKKGIATASLSGRLAAFFGITAFLSAISILSGWGMYNSFEHARGYTNPPSHTLAVAVASVWGPVAMGLFGCYWLWRGKKGPSGESGRAASTSSAK